MAQNHCVGTGAAERCVIVLAGGAGQRMGLVDKPTLPVAGAAMLHRVLHAGTGARIRVVVGPPELPVPPGVGQARERPVGGGPVAGLAAGLTALGPGDDEIPRQVAVLGCDLPFLTAGSLDALSETLARTGAHVAVYRDATGRRQLLCGVWWEPVLRAVLPGDPHGAPMRSLFTELNVAELDYTGDGPPPWYDCDTPEDLATAREWAE
jgi:molybdopterin-guanine dinucleotide biosynthesis protein A